MALLAGTLAPGRPSLAAESARYASPTERARHVAAGPAEVAAMKQAVLDATSVFISHSAARHLPVPYGTRPCRLKVELGRFERTLGREWIPRFAKAMNVEGVAAAAGDSIERACKADSLRGDHFSIRFGKGKKAVFVTPDLARGTARYSWSDSLESSVSIVSEGSDLRALIAQALPKDMTLVGIQPCVDSLATSRSVNTGPSVVYVEQLPDVIERVPPSYPEAARRANVEGTVLVQALVSKQGVVVETMIAKSIPMLDEQAVRAVESWRFKPALSGGEPIAVWVAVPVRFRLK